MKKNTITSAKQSPVSKKAESTGREDAKILKSLTVAEWIEENNITDYSLYVRENANGYPYVTFIDHKNEGFNVYFSLKLAKLYAADDEVAEIPFNEYAMVQVSYPETEEYEAYTVWKISSNENSKRARVSTLKL